MTKRAPTFSASQFTPTQWSSATDKARFANQIVRFVQSDFDPNLFTKATYERLSMCFGHIAHYDRGGFYATWFASTEDRAKWLYYVSKGGALGACGDPSYTFSDVEQALSKWVQHSGLAESYGQQVSNDTEIKERALLAALKAKYEPSRLSTCDSRVEAAANSAL